MRKLLALALLLLAGCPKNEGAADAGPPAPKGPTPVVEAEPNDELAHAQKLAGPSVVSANLGAALPGKKADEDWYELPAAPAGQRGTLSVDPVPGLDLALELYDADKIKRLTRDAQPGGQPEVVHSLAPGKVWLVRVFNKKPEAGGAYKLTYDLQPDDGSTELEPNNRAADATVLAVGKPVQGWLSDPLDEDYFHLTLPEPPDAGAPAPAPAPVDAGAPAPTPVDAGVVPAPGPVADAGAAPVADAGAPVVEADAGAALDAGAVPDAGPPAPPPPPPVLMHLSVSAVPGVRLEVSVLNAAEASIYSVTAKNPGEPVEVRNLALRGPARDFFVVVRSARIGSGKEAKRGYSVDQPYTVSLSLEEAKGAVELEPNDDLAHATPVDLTGGVGVLEGYLSPKGDVDYYVLRSDKPALARIDLSGVDHVDLELSVVRAGPSGKDEVLLTANDGEVKEPEVLTNVAVGPGETYLKIQGAARKNAEGKWTRDSENARDPYRLTVALSPDDPGVEHEPNNEASIANPITLGGSVRGTIHPRHDVDYFKLDLSGQLVKTNLKATCTGILKVDIALYLYRLKPDGSLTLVQTSDTGKGDAPESITYAAEPGVYLFKVQDTKSRESNFLDSYTLRVEAQ